VQTSNMPFLSQPKYVHDLLTKLSIHKHKFVSMSLPFKTTLSLIHSEKYANGFAILIMTRPDISYIVNLVSQLMHEFYTAHLTIVHYILRYL